MQALAVANPTKLPTAARAIIVGFGLSYFGTGLILPINAIYITRAAGAGSHTAVAFFLLLPLGGLVGGMASGRALDAIGARPIGAVGFALQGIGWLMIAASGFPAFLLAAAVVAGLGTGTAAAALRSQLSLVCLPEQRTRAYAVRNFAVNLGATGGAAGVAVCALSGHVDYRLLYVLNAFSFWIFGSLVWFYTRNVAQVPRKKPDALQGGLLRSRQVAAGLAAHLLVITFGFGLTETVLPLFLHGLLQQSLTFVGLATAIGCGSALVLQLPVERFVRRFQARTTFRLHTAAWLSAWVIGAAAALTRGWARTSMLLIMLLVFEVGVCVYESNFQAHLASVVPESKIGTANGFVSLSYNIGMIISASGGVLFIEHVKSAETVFAVLASGVIASGIMLWIFAGPVRAQQ